jgi:transcriptional regulator with XRE-family HTH domain
LNALGGGPQQRQLAEALKRLRVSAGLSGHEVARRIGFAASNVSRIEAGRQRISVPQVAAWCRVTGAAPEYSGELLQLAEDVLVGAQSWTTEAGGRFTDFQAEVAELEARTGLLSEYQPAVLPGMLQTPAQARRIFSSGPDGVLPGMDARIAARISRQRILYDENRNQRFVIPESVLYSPFGPRGDPEVTVEHRQQLAAVDAAVKLPGVTISVLPSGASPVWRLAGFVLYDDVTDGEPQVHLEWLTRPFNIFEPDQVEMCRQAFANLLAASVTGDEARRLITAAAASLRDA